MKVYRALNLENGMSYIGTTKKSIETRKKDHLRKAENNKPGKFYESIRGYSPDSFIWIELEKVSTVEELALKEQYYIDLYDTVQNGYNSDRGGGFQKPVFMFDLSGNLVSEFDSLVSAANAVNANKKSISNACYNPTKRLGNNL